MTNIGNIVISRDVTLLTKARLVKANFLEEISSISHSVVFLYFFAWIIEKAREFQKNIYFCFTDYAKAFVWITINCGKF